MPTTGEGCLCPDALLHKTSFTGHSGSGKEPLGDPLEGTIEVTLGQIFFFMRYDSLVIQVVGKHLWGNTEGAITR